MKIRQTTPREVILDLRAAHKHLDGVHPKVFISTVQLAIEQAIDCIEELQRVIELEKDRQAQ